MNRLGDVIESVTVSPTRFFVEGNLLGPLSIRPYLDFEYERY